MRPVERLDPLGARGGARGVPPHDDEPPDVAQGEERFGVADGLRPAPDDDRRVDDVRRQHLQAHGGHSGGPHLGELLAVEQHPGSEGLTVEEDVPAVDPGQAAVGVVGRDADELDPGDARQV